MLKIRCPECKKLFESELDDLTEFLESNNWILILEDKNHGHWICPDCDPKKNPMDKVQKYVTCLYCGKEMIEIPFKKWSHLQGIMSHPSCFEEAKTNDQAFIEVDFKKKCEECGDPYFTEEYLGKDEDGQPVYRKYCTSCGKDIDS